MVFLLLKSGFMAGQGDQCEKLKIAVINKGVYGDSTLFYLNKIHNKNWPIETWLSEIDSKILEELNKAGYNDLEFFSPATDPNKDIDLKYLYDFWLWSVDKDNPSNKYANTYFKDHVLHSTNQQMVFMIRSQLEIYSSCYCGPSRNFIISMEDTYSATIYQAVKNLVALNWPMDRKLWHWESEHIAPAREPEMEIRYEKDYLSLLDETSRKMEVYIKVRNCRGQYVYLPFNGQLVYFLKETERLKHKVGKKCSCEADCDSYSPIYTNQEYEAIGEYTVIKGLEPSLETLRYKTCGIGNNSLIEVEGEIKVLGLELEVEPDRKVIHNGEQTSIQIDLHELDPDGTEILSCAGKEVDVKVTGLVDGKVSHESGMITLNEVGVAFIDYKAGQKDRQIKITATFTPPKYPEELKAEATITVKQFEYDATLTIKASYNKTENSSSKEANGWGYSERTHDLNESREALVYVPLKMENAYDVEAQNLRYEYYRPLDINLSSFNASFRSKDYNSNIGSDEGGKTTILKHKIPSDQKISLKETLLQLYIVMTLDMKTDKVMKINIDGFNVEFTWKETVDSHHESWWKPPPSPGHETIDKTETDTEEDTFCACPVEDPIPDPIIKSSTESIKKYLKDLGVALPENAEVHEEEEIPIIEPDLLVKFGDGTTFFGGEGRKVVDESKGSSVRRKEMTFTWQVTRKKKPL